MMVVLEFIVMMVIWILGCAFVHYIIPDADDSYKMLAGVVTYLIATMLIDMCE